MKNETLNLNWLEIKREKESVQRKEQEIMSIY